MRFMQKAVIVLFVISALIFGFSKVSELFGTSSSAPAIWCEEKEIKVSCNYTEEEILAGVTAKDKQDGDLTSEIIVGSISRFTEKGRAKVTYVVFDSSNQSATYTREVIFEDYVSPRFELAKPLVIKTNTAVNEKELVGATDIFDGDISSRTKVIDSNINNSVAGDYVIGVELTNSFGDLVEAKLPVHVVTEPETRVDITLKNNVLYLEKGENFNPLSYVERVTSFYGKALDKSVVNVENYVNTEKAGCYEVKFTATDETGNRGVTYLIVFVTERGQ